MRAVLDPNVIISALLSPDGAPAQVLSAWREGAFDLLVSPKLMAELRRALSYPKLQSRIEPQDSSELLDWLNRSAIHVADPPPPPVSSADPDDDYLIALAAGENAVLVSGDKHLLALANDAPVFAPRRFLESLAA